MKTVQMTLDDELVDAVDSVVRKMKTTRSAFTRKALQEALAHYNNARLEQKHKKGYESAPVKGDEFSVWENEQAWGDE